MVRLNGTCVYTHQWTHILSPNKDNPYYGNDNHHTLPHSTSQILITEIESKGIFRITQPCVASYIIRYWGGKGQQVTTPPNYRQWCLWRRQDHHEGSSPPAWVHWCSESHTCVSNAGWTLPHSSGPTHHHHQIELIKIIHSSDHK